MSGGAWISKRIEQSREIGQRVRELTADLSFWSGTLQAAVTAPAGFRHNGPSFPLIVGGDGEEASAIHDFMYSRPDLYTRAQADAVFREALAASGMGRVRRTGWWLGVRAFGWNFYGKADEPPEEHPFDPSPGG